MDHCNYSESSHIIKVKSEGEKNCVDFRSATPAVHYFELCNFRNVELEVMEREAEIVSTNFRNYIFFFCS